MARPTLTPSLPGQRRDFRRGADQRRHVSDWLQRPYRLDDREREQARQQRDARGQKRYDGQSEFVLSGAAAATWTGTAFIFGNATLQFASGGITTIGSGASLDLIGSGAQILTNGGASSALSGLTSNEGTLEFRALSATPPAASR